MPPFFYFCFTLFAFDNSPELILNASCVAGSKHKDLRMNKTRPLCSMSSQRDRHINKATVAAMCLGRNQTKNRNNKHCVEFTFSHSTTSEHHSNCNAGQTSPVLAARGAGWRMEMWMWLVIRKTDQEWSTSPRLWPQNLHIP